MQVEPLILPIADPYLFKEYSRLAPSNFHCCLQGLDPFGTHAKIVGVGITSDRHPVGIALASVYSKIKTCDIHVFNIENAGEAIYLASKLLNTLTNILSEQGVRYATFAYEQENPFSSILEKVFKNAKWEGPQPFMIDCLFKRDDFNPDWWNKKIELDAGFEEFFFETLHGKEQKDLLFYVEQNGIPDYINPYGHKKNLIEYKNSLGLRYKGKIIGWMITHRIQPDTISYAALYLDNDFASTRYWLKLLIDALRIHQNLEDAPYGFLEINLGLIPDSWLKFIEKRLFPQTCKITHKSLFTKSLEKINS